VKVTGPVASGAETSLAIVTVGGVVSGPEPGGAGVFDTGGGGGSASLPPQLMSAEQTSIRVATSWKVDRCDMVFVSAEDGVGGADGPAVVKALSNEHNAHGKT
jgi:hypothetical protein